MPVIKDKDVSAAETLLNKSAKGVTFLLFGQMFTKLSTFVLNQILISYISPKILGINAFLEFLLSTILFFSREGIRLSSQRIKDYDLEDDEDSEKEASSKLDKYGHNRIVHGTKIALSQSIINISYVPLFIGVPLSTIIMYWQYGKITEYFTHMHFFNASLLVIWVAIFLELLSEPIYILNQFNLNYDKRTSFESIAITVSCFVNFGIIFWFKDQQDSPFFEGLPILAFALAKLAHSVVLLLLYFIDFRRNREVLSVNGKVLHVRLTKIYDNSLQTSYYYFDHDILNHFYKIFFQICFKHLLTEGDKLVINSLCTIEEQGIYSLISNYGSLLARLVFSPIEESLRNFLTRLLLSNKSKKNLNLSVEILSKIIIFYIYLSILISIFGPLNSGYLIQKLIGNNWSNMVSNTIPLYTLYLPLLAFNGILEAAHQSTATGNEIVSYTYYMVFFSGVFMLSSYVTIEKLGLALDGLIISNMLNMFLRILYCSKFIQSFYKRAHMTFNVFKLDSNLKSIFALSSIVWIMDVSLFGITRNLYELMGNLLFAGILVSFIMYKEKLLILSIIKREPLIRME